MPPKSRKLFRAGSRSCQAKAVNDNQAFEVSDKTTASRLLHSLNELRKVDSLCDVRLKADGGVVSAHKVVLAASCEYFHAMFSHQMAESSAELVILEGVSVQMLQLVIDFMYTGVLQVNKEEVPDLAMLLDMMQLSEMKDKCVQLMTDEIHIYNCIGMFQFGKRFVCDDLREKAAFVIQQRFQAVSKSPEFLTCSAELVGEIFSWDNLVLGTEGEDSVVEAALRWVKHDLAQRRESLLYQVLPHIELANASPNSVKSLLELSESEGWREAIQQQLEASSGRKRTTVFRLAVGGGFLQSRTGVETLTMTEQQLNSVGSDAASDAETPNWSPIASLPRLPSYSKAFNIEGNLVAVLCFTAEENTPAESCVLEYSAVRDAWETLDVPPQLLHHVTQCFTMMGAMTYCSARRVLYIVTNSFMVCVRIEVENEDITFEKFDYIQHNLMALCSLQPSGATQQEVATDAEMRAQEDELQLELSGANLDKTVLCHFALETLNEQLYLIGGSQVRSKTESFPDAAVYLWDAERRSWRRKADMTQSRACHAAVVLDNQIYAIGGYNRFRLKTAERYNCDTDRWERIADMARFRSHTTAVPVGDRIFVLGGKSYAWGCGGARKVLSVVEVYSRDRDTWTELCRPMRSARCMAMAAAF